MEIQTQTTAQTVAIPVLQCKYCKNPVAENFYFCPNCGKKLKEPPFKFSWGKTITIIIGAILFPPFGLIPGIKYLFKDDIKAQIIGVITIVLTFIVTGILIVYSINLFKQISGAYQQINQSQGSINSLLIQP